MRETGENLMKNKMEIKKIEKIKMFIIQQIYI